MVFTKISGPNSGTYLMSYTNLSCVCMFDYFSYMLNIMVIVNIVRIACINYSRKRN